MAVRYWLDSDVLIQSKNGPYGLDFAPTFWKWLERCISDGKIRSPMRVHKELTDYKDELAEWAKRRRAEGLFFVDAGQSVQKVYQTIANHVTTTYVAAQAAKFLAGADGWVISHAKESNGVVVTHEAAVNKNSKKAKIPNVCDHFKVPCMNLQDMRKAIGGLKL
jgi:hypothetical protein